MSLDGIFHRLARGREDLPQNYFGHLRGKGEEKTAEVEARKSLTFLLRLGKGSQEEPILEKRIRKLRGRNRGMGSKTGFLSGGRAERGFSMLEEQRLRESSAEISDVHDDENFHGGENELARKRKDPHHN